MTKHGTAEVMGNFRTERYAALNKCRWEHFLGMGINLKNKTIFEPGAGVGDQTEWLLSQEPKHIFVNEGREENMDIIRQRFNWDRRVSFHPGHLETCLEDPIFEFYVDLIFCYGVYYHARESYPDFPIMRQLSKLGRMIAFDYLAGSDNEVYYGYDNPSTSISQYGLRPRRESMAAGLKTCWEYVYEPKEHLTWTDPVAAEDRIVAVASHSKLHNPNLIQI